MGNAEENKIEIDFPIHSGETIDSLDADGKMQEVTGVRKGNP